MDESMRKGQAMLAGTMSPEEALAAVGSAADELARALAIAAGDWAHHGQALARISRTMLQIAHEPIEGCSCLGCPCQRMQQLQDEQEHLEEISSWSVDLARRLQEYGQTALLDLTTQAKGTISRHTPGLWAYR